jgi:hypothetical protein
VTIKTSDKTILRIKDLSEQPPSRFVLLPAGLERVIIALDAYEILDGIFTAYIGDDHNTPIFTIPVAAGFVLIDRLLTDHETLYEVMKRMHADEKEAEKIHDELTKGDSKHKHDGEERGKVIQFPGREPDPTVPGQYL